MDTTYEIRNDCLFLKVTGDFDINRSIEIMYETNEKLRTHNLNKFFLDITEETGLDDRKKLSRKYMICPL
jgi:anti-anti-sigma regulatory factor